MMHMRWRSLEMNPRASHVSRQLTGEEKKCESYKFIYVYLIIASSILYAVIVRETSGKPPDRIR